MDPVTQPVGFDRQRARDLAKPHQKALLEEYRRRNPELPLGPRLEAAFFDVPRHEFVDRFRVVDGADESSEPGDWVTPRGEKAFVRALPELYADRPLILLEDERRHVISTVSQPTFVLYMLQLLEIRPRHRVFELGTGSGWNAALISRLVSPGGRVVTFEIVPELAESARVRLARLGATNVRVEAGDGTAGAEGEAPFDRAIFTAGAADLPGPFFDQVRDGGLALVVMKGWGGDRADLLLLLRKKDKSFTLLMSRLCGFVEMKGRLERADPFPLGDLPTNPARFALSIHPRDVVIHRRPGDRLIIRDEAQFHWIPR